MPAAFDTGFFVRTPAWHRLGTVLKEFPGRREAMRLAGHLFRVEERESYGRDRDGFIFRIIDEKRLVKVDEETGEETHMKTLATSFVPVQNETCWDIIDALVNQPRVRYETGGVLMDGALCFVTAWLDEPGFVPGDPSPIWPYVFCNWGHIGNGGINAGATSIREVCANTVAMAESQSEAAGRMFRFRHTKNVMDRIEDAKMVIRGAGQAHSEFMELAEELAAIKVTKAQRDFFVTQLIPTPGTALISERVKRNIEAARAQVESLFTGHTIPEAHAFTGYGLLQAGTEYLDHLRGFRNDYTYVGRTLLRPEPLKAKLVPLIHEVAKV